MSIVAWRPRTVSRASVLPAVLACGLALSPLSPKIAGVVWLLFSAWGLALCLRHRDPATAPAGLAAARLWLLACGVATVLGGAALCYWSGPFDELNAELRLLIAALGTWGVLAHARVLPGTRHIAMHAVAASCAAAFLCGVLVIALHRGDARLFLPANAIVWALAVAFSLCLLLPMALDGAAETPVARRWWYAAMALGVVTVLLSQSRGALGVLVWMLWLLVERWRRRHGHWPVGRLAGLALGCAVLAGALWMAPGDPLRLRQAGNEIAEAEAGEFNTSLGTRMYLWRMAWQGIESSPWIGIGGAERLRRIKHAGEELPEAQRAGLWYVRLMGHVHNQYLHAALDGGVVGLGAIAVLMAGMAGVAWRLRRIDPLASRQAQGLLFVHATASMSNVDFAHNYYVLALATGMTIVLLGAAQTKKPAVLR